MKGRDKTRDTTFLHKNFTIFAFLSTIRDNLYDYGELPTPTTVIRRRISEARSKTISMLSFHYS